MILANVQIAGSNTPVDISIRDGLVVEISKPGNASSHTSEILRFEGDLVFPGLINSHDHLDFNSFPLLGNRLYRNYVEWGVDIHEHNKKEINQILRIPKRLRVKWGIYKNLLNGITTVVNHGPKQNIEDKLISIYQNCYSLHSVRLEKHWKLKLNDPRKSIAPFVIHIGEGTDQASGEEIDRLIRWNILQKELIGVHGVAMTPKQARKFKAVIWCPDSNYFLLNRTAGIDRLKEHTTILFGTDSTLTGSWNLWEQLRLARKTGLVNDQELFNMLTINPASVWKLKGSGSIKQSLAADLVVSKVKDEGSGLDGFYNLNPEDLLLIIHKGKILLFDDSLHSHLLEKFANDSFSSVYIRGKRKYVLGQLPQLMNEIKEYCPAMSFPITS